MAALWIVLNGGRVGFLRKNQKRRRAALAAALQIKSFSRETAPQPGRAQLQP